MRAFTCFAALVLLPATAAAQSRPQRSATTPVLVVHITVDQMRGDYLDRFGHQLSGGLARLRRGGAWFSDAHLEHALAETAPGHATVLSGRVPASTGIIRNSEGVADAGAPLLEVRGPGASPRRFRGTVLYDWMRRRWPASRFLSVSRKDRSAILPMGRNRGPVYWYAGGNFTTSRYYADSLSGWVRSFNLAAQDARAPGRAWTLLLDPREYPEPDSATWENNGRNFVFPHVIPDGPAALEVFHSTPWLDSITLAFALEGLEQERLGRGPQPDLLAISLSALDYVGHDFGPDSREVHDMVLRVDRLLGAFLDSLFRLRDSTRIIISLTADHGVHSFPEYWNARGDTMAMWVRVDTLLERYRRALTQAVGPGDWIPRDFEAGLLLLDRRGLAARRFNVDSLIAALREDLLRVRGVERVDSRASLARADTAYDVVARRWRNQVSDETPAELFITLRPHAVWGRTGLRIAEHGQPRDPDTRVPILLWGPGIRPGLYQERAAVTDIAPTLARLLGIAPLERVNGRVLREAIR